MCDPITIGGLAISGTAQVMAGLSAVSGIAGAVAAGKKGQATADMAGEQRQLQSDEINASNSNKVGERVKQARAERSRLRVAAGESGVTGQSFAAQLMDSAFQEDMDVATIGDDNKFAQRASQGRADSIVAGAKGPGLLATGLQIAAGSVGAAASVDGGLTIKKG